MDCVAFTGSVETGQRIAHTCIDRVARINLELGGKDPFIVCADVAAEIEVAARGGAWAAYLNAGQVCTSAERFYVDHSVYDDFLSAFVDHARSLRVGDPLADDTDMGPMVSEAQRAKVERQLEAAVGAGAEIVFGGDHAGHSTRLVHGADGGHRRGRRDRPAERGDVRPGRADRPGEVARRGDRARQLARASGSAPTSTRATSRRSSAACARSRPARCGSTTR